MPPIDQWSGSTFANLPIGQGLSMTLLQMTGMYQTIANDGVRIPPRIIKTTIAADGTRTDEPRPEGVRVVSPQTAQTVRQMLRATVQRDPTGVQQGTGPQAAVDGYQIAGKTGTAQQINPGCGCYYDDVYWITFAGMAPTDDPALRHRHHGRQPATHGRRPARHDDGAAVPQHRRLAAAAGERAAVARPGSAADASGHLSAGSGPQPGRYCVMAMNLRPNHPVGQVLGRLAEQVRAVPAGRRHGAERAGHRGDTARPERAARRSVRGAARGVVARRALRRRGGDTGRRRGAHRRRRASTRWAAMSACPC